jgi:hypothetical protein
MEEGRPSFTALGAAMLRAAHLLWDDPPKIFEDTLALRLSDCESEAVLRVQLDQLAAEFARRSSPDFAQVALRYLRSEVMTARLSEGSHSTLSWEPGSTPLRIADRTWRRFYAFMRSIIPPRKLGSERACRT